MLCTNGHNLCDDLGISWKIKMLDSSEIWNEKIVFMEQRTKTVWIHVVAL